MRWDTVYARMTVARGDPSNNAKVRRFYKEKRRGFFAEVTFPTPRWANFAKNQRQLGGAVGGKSFRKPPSARAGDEKFGGKLPKVL